MSIKYNANIILASCHDPEKHVLLCLLKKKSTYRKKKGATIPHWRKKNHMLHMLIKKNCNDITRVRCEFMEKKTKKKTRKAQYLTGVE